MSPQPRPRAGAGTARARRSGGPASTLHLVALALGVLTPGAALAGPGHCVPAYNQVVASGASCEAPSATATDYVTFSCDGTELRRIWNGCVEAPPPDYFDPTPSGWQATCATVPTVDHGCNGGDPTGSGCSNDGCELTPDPLQPHCVCTASCSAGTESCSAPTPATCQPRPIDTREVCGDARDDNCDGRVNEDCPPNGGWGRRRP